MLYNIQIYNDFLSNTNFKYLVNYYLSNRAHIYLKMPDTIGFSEVFPLFREVEMLWKREICFYMLGQLDVCKHISYILAI